MWAVMMRVYINTLIFCVLVSGCGFMDEKPPPDLASNVLNKCFVLVDDLAAWSDICEDTETWGYLQGFNQVYMDGLPNPNGIPDKEDMTSETSFYRCPERFWGLTLTSGVRYKKIPKGSKLYITKYNVVLGLSDGYENYLYARIPEYGIEQIKLSGERFMGANFGIEGALYSIPNRYGEGGIEMNKEYLVPCE